MTKLCNTCEYLKYCARSGIEEVGCDRYKKDMTTNEEWFCSLSTEKKAKFLRKIYRDGRDDYVGEWYEQTEADFVEWLREIHHAE